MQQRLSDDLLDGAAAAAEYVFGDPTKRRRIYRMTETGDLPVVAIGRRLYYSKEALRRVFQVAA